MKHIRVLVADEHTMMFEGLRRLLEEHCEVVGGVEDGMALVESVGHMQPDVVILEIGLPLLNGLEAGRQIKQLYPNVKLIYLTMYTNSSYVNKAMDLGASGYLLKKSTASELLQALDLAQRGHCYVTPLVTKGLIQGLMKGQFPLKGSIEKLTVRQREVLQLVAEGYSIKAIADLLKLSPKTVAFHKANLMLELQLHSTAALTRYAIEGGVLPTPPSMPH